MNDSVRVARKVLWAVIALVQIGTVIWLFKTQDFGLALAIVILAIHQNGGSE